MILLIQNTSIIICTHIFHMQKNEPIDFLVLIRDIIYLLLLLITAYVSYNHIVIFWTIRKFHHNMNVLMCFTFGSWIEVFTAALLTWPYRVGLIGINESGEKFDGLESDEMTVVTRVPSTIPLFIGSFLFWHYSATNIAGITMFVLERGAASFLFNNYEKHERSFISIFLLTASQFWIFVIMFSFFFQFIHLKLVLVVSCITFICTVFLLVFLLYYNINLQNKLAPKSTSLDPSYSLNARFQAAENVRSFKLAAGLVIVIGASTFGALIILTIVNLDILSVEVEQAIYWGYETVFTLNPLFIVPTTLYSIPEWKHTFLQKVPILRNHLPPIPKNIEVRRVSLETHVYFQQLQSSWN